MSSFIPNKQQPYDFSHKYYKKKSYITVLIPIAMVLIVLVLIILNFQNNSNNSMNSNFPENSVEKIDDTSFEEYHDLSSGKNSPSLSTNEKPDNIEFVKLYDLLATNSSDKKFIYYDYVKDNYGNTYSEGYGGGDGYSKTWQEYTIGRKYKWLSGTVVLNYDYRTQTNDDIFFWIYGDDISIFMSNNINAGYESQQFKIDISDVENLRLVISGSNMIRLVDCVLYENDFEQVYSTMNINNCYNLETPFYLVNYDFFSASENKTFIEYDSVIDNLGNTYNNGIGGGDGYSKTWQEYHLNKKYKMLRGTIVLNYDYRDRNTDNVFVWIYGDGNLLFQSNLIVSGYMSQDFDIDLSEINVLRIEIQGEYLARIVDCVVYGDEGQQRISSKKINDRSYKAKVYLSNIDYYAASDQNAFIYYDNVRDNLGNIYANGIGGSDGYSKSWQSYYLNSQFKKMEGIVVLNDETKDQESDKTYIWIYADDTLIFQSNNVSKGYTSEKISLDLTDVKILRVEIQGKTMIRLVDCIIYK